MIELRIDVKKIMKSSIYSGEKGNYLTLRLKERKDGVDDYGNIGFIVQVLSKEDKELDIKPPIVGNYKEIDWDKVRGEKAQTPATSQDEEDDIPF
jgi:hypothetical protein